MISTVSRYSAKGRIDAGEDFLNTPNRRDSICLNCLLNHDVSALFVSSCWLDSPGLPIMRDRRNLNTGNRTLCAAAGLPPLSMTQ